MKNKKNKSYMKNKNKRVGKGGEHRRGAEQNLRKRDEIELFDDGMSVEDAGKAASHYFTSDDNLEDDIRNFEYRIGTTTLKLTSNSGVFSKNHVDKASKLLVETVLKEEADRAEGDSDEKNKIRSLALESARKTELSENESTIYLSKSIKSNCELDGKNLSSLRIADLGTGYGVILLALLSKLKDSTGVGYEVSSRAMRLARINAKKNGLKARADFVREDIRKLLEAEMSSDSEMLQKSEGFDSEETSAVEEKRAVSAPTEKDFDIVVTNPPIRAGKAVCYNFYDFAKSRLKEGGRLYVVISKNQGAPSTKKHLANLFGNAEFVAKEGEFRVICSVK